MMLIDQQLNHSVKLNPKHRFTYAVSGGIHDAWAWCREHYGPPEQRADNEYQFRWTWMDKNSDRIFLFRDEADASMFALIWA